MLFPLIVIAASVLACLAMAALNALHLRDPVRWRKRRDTAKFSKFPAHLAAKEPARYRHGARVRLVARVAVWLALALLLLAALAWAQAQAQEQDRRIEGGVDSLTPAPASPLSGR